jgi:hypothetical protein
VIPVLVDGASMPRSGDLPDDLKLLADRNALEVRHTSFQADSERLITALDQTLKEARAERRKRGLTSPGKKIWLSVAGVVTVLALVVVAAILYFGSTTRDVHGLQMLLIKGLGNISDQDATNILDQFAPPTFSKAGIPKIRLQVLISNTSDFVTLSKMGEKIPH